MWFWKNLQYLNNLEGSIYDQRDGYIIYALFSLIYFNALIYYQYYQIIKVKDDNVVILPNFHHGSKLGELNVFFFLIPYRRAHGAKYGERAMSYRALNKIG